MNWKLICMIAQGWLLIGMVLLGIGIIIAGAIWAPGGVATLTTLFGLGCIFAGMAGLHG